VPARLSLSEIHVLQHSLYRNAAVTIHNQKKNLLKKILPKIVRAAGTEFISNKIHLTKFPKNRSRSAAGTLLRLPLPPSKSSLVLYLSQRDSVRYILARVLDGLRYVYNLGIIFSLFNRYSGKCHFSKGCQGL
jgi:hypothetical protein